MLMELTAAAQKLGLKLQGSQEQKGRHEAGPFLTNVQPKLGLRSHRTRSSDLQGAAMSENQEPFFFFCFFAMVNTLQVWTG
jgi:hypothetical protein